jgi:hypothetical protein
MTYSVPFVPLRGEWTQLTPQLWETLVGESDSPGHIRLQLAEQDDHIRLTLLSDSFHILTRSTTFCQWKVVAGTLQAIILKHPDRTQSSLELTRWMLSVPTTIEYFLNFEYFYRRLGKN